MNSAEQVVDKQADAEIPSPAASGTPATPGTKPKGRKLAVMWSLTFITGLTFISLTGTPDPDKPLLVLLRLAVPVVLMVAYARYGYQSAKSIGEFAASRSALVGQLADSLYFLGFLWTLWALIDSFTIHQMSIAEAVFRAFGFALVTTATGMFLRLMLLQFWYSEEDPVRLGERYIEEEIGRFTKEVTRAVESIGGFRTRTDAALTQWISSLNKSTGELKTAVDDVNTQTTDLKDALVEMRKVSAENIGKLVDTALDQFTRKLVPSLEALIDANNQFVMQMNASAKTLKERVESGAQKMENAVDAGVNDIEATVQAGTGRVQLELSGGLDAIRNILDKSTQTMDKTTTVFATRLSAPMANLESSLVNLSEQIREIRVPADVVEKTVAEQVDRVKAPLEESANAFQEAIDHLAKQIREIRVPADMVEKTGAQQVARATASLVGSTNAFQEAIDHLAKQIREIRVPADIVERTMAQQSAVVNASLMVSTRPLQEAIDSFRRSVQAVKEQMQSQRGSSLLTKIKEYFFD